LKRHDLVIVGGGTAGLVSGMIAGWAGARVALIEAERTGGDCLWTGCVPSKSLIAAADLAQRIREGRELGVMAGEPKVDFSRVMGHVHAARKKIEPHDSPERLREAGVEVIQGRATYTGPGRIEVDGSELRWRTSIIATGSRPALPPVAGLEESDPLTSDTVWDLEELPASLLVLGAGPIGCELGQAFSRLGSRVTIVEMGDHLLPREDPDVGQLLAGQFRREGIDIWLNTTAKSIDTAADGSVTLDAVSPQGRLDLSFDRVLSAAGRRPSSSGIGLEMIGVETGPGGEVMTDERLRAGVPGVFAAGDVTGAMPFTHVAAYHAQIATPNALFRLRRKVDYGSIPNVTFTDPEVAGVGLSEAQARTKWGSKAKIARHDYADLDRAITAGRTAGFAKLIGDSRGRLVGATIVGQSAGESIGEMALRISKGQSIDSISSDVHAYPTFAEGAARAADDYRRERFEGPGLTRLSKPFLRLLRTLDRSGRR
jgi:pyruvate/2-oxoglutarate dehydrogenase complex dihydrolipoamide dehydrogenase (E3) component